MARRRGGINPPEQPATVAATHGDVPTRTMATM